MDDKPKSEKPKKTQRPYVPSDREIREAMQARAYRRGRNGAIRQVRFED